MLQVILVILGLLSIIKGKYKVSKTRVINKPISTYFGLVAIAYGIAISFIPETLIYGISFWVSLLVVSVILITKGEVVAPDKVESKTPETKRNTIILWIAIIVIAGLFYFSIK